MQYRYFIIYIDQLYILRTDRKYFFILKIYFTKYLSMIDKNTDRINSSDNYNDEKNRDILK